MTKFCKTESTILPDRGNLNFGETNTISSKNIFFFFYSGWQETIQCQLMFLLFLEIDNKMFTLAIHQDMAINEMRVGNPITYPLEIRYPSPNSSDI